MATIALPDRSWAVDPVERQALIPSHITTRDELAAWEQANITRAVAWLAQRPNRWSVLTGRFLRSLHKRMFDETWNHAGRYRRTKSELGAATWAISTRVEDVVARMRAWIKAGAYPADEIAVRFHHRLSEIRPFERGNGRVARLIADALIVELGGLPFTWGADGGLEPGELSERYRAALRRADADDISDLLAFARS